MTDPHGELAGDHLDLIVGKAGMALDGRAGLVGSDK